MGFPDNLMTEMAGFTKADSVSISWRGYYTENERFQVQIGRMDSPLENPWTLINGVGGTVEEAMARAIAKRLAYYTQGAA